MENVERYIVRDMKTDLIKGTYKDRASARKQADRLDLEYGAIRYRVEIVRIQL